MTQPPTTPNLAVNTVVGEWKITGVIDAAKGNYIMERIDPTIATAIAEWSAARVYNTGNICIRNKAFFASAVDGNVGKDPLIDLSGAWGPFVPGETNNLFYNRAPTSADVYPVGVKWYDTSFGSDTPLVQISMGNGVWAYLNQITLAKIRLYCNGVVSTYRSSINNIKFFKPDGTQIPNSWFVWGASSGIGGGTPGLAYAGQQIYCGYNSSGYVDIECSSQFDPSITIGKLTGDYPAAAYVQCSRVEFWYTNGSKKVFSGTGYVLNAGATTCTCDPAVICRYGDATAAAQGVMLTAGQLANANDTTYGRVSGAAFCSAVATLTQSLAARITALEPKAVLAMTTQKGFPSADQNFVTLTPPAGKTFKAGGLYWMLNRIAPDNATISQGTGGTNTVNYAVPTTPGTYQVILQPQYDDGTSGDIRENFTV